MASQAIPGWPRNSLRVLLVEQESVGDARDAIDTVMESDVHLAALWAQARVLREATLRCGESVDVVTGEVFHEVRLVFAGPWTFGCLYFLHVTHIRQLFR